MNEIKGTVATKGTLKGTLQGVYGKDGLSAYEIALKNGFEGTEQEWLASLKGADGAMSFEDLTEEQKASLKGDKGDRGLSGVYLGSGDMPEDCNVQIDPNGDALTVVADQTYSPTSTNAQSGKAVAEALANVGGGDWELINTITVVPDADGGLPSSVKITLDSDGNPFELVKVKAIFETDTANGVYTNGTLNFNLLLSYSRDEPNRALFLANVLPTAQGKYARSVFDAELVDGKVYCKGVGSNALKSFADSETADNFEVKGNLGVALKTQYIDTVGFNAYVPFYAGSKMYLYGVRK